MTRRLNWLLPEELIKDLEADPTQSPMLIGHIGIETDNLVQIRTLATDILWMKFIPTELEHFQDVFDGENAGKLPDLKETDHAIAIMDDKVPPPQPVVPPLREGAQGPL